MGGRNKYLAGVRERGFGWGIASKAAHRTVLGRHL